MSGIIVQHLEDQHCRNPEEAEVLKAAKVRRSVRQMRGGVRRAGTKEVE